MLQTYVGRLAYLSSIRPRFSTPASLRAPKATQAAPLEICAGGLPLGGKHARVADFEYLEDPEDASALRRIRFAPGLDFNALVTAIMDGAAALLPEEPPSGAAPGTGREDAPRQGEPLGQPLQRRHVSIKEEEADSGAAAALAVTHATALLHELCMRLPRSGRRQMHASWPEVLLVWTTDDT